MTVRKLSRGFNEKIRVSSNLIDPFPVGTIFPLAYNGTPDGYLKCNGTAVDRTVYSDLFQTIGTTYGAGNGSTTFNIPDLRGCFLRGLDESRGLDPSRSLGTFQDQDIASHNHTAPSIYSYVGGAGTGSELSASAGNIGNSGSESRPKNYSVVYIIKFRKN